MSEITLGNHITTLKGFAFKSGWYSESGTPIVKVSNFTGDSVDTSNLTYLPENIASEYTKYGIYSGDIVIQTVGSWPNNPQSVVGKVIRVPENAAGALLNQNAVKIEPDESLDKAYLYYVLKSDSFKKYIIGTAQGAANQASITLDAIRSYSFKRIPLSVQCKIASTLSAYDDLIENSTLRIKILEEMARMLYREWFVNFRFPGHENVKMVESQIGRIPEGWEVKGLGDVAQEMRRGINPEEVAPETPYFGLEHLPRRSLALTEWGTAAEVQSSKLMFNKSEILFGKIRPYFHKVGVAPVDGICSTDTIVIGAKDRLHFPLVLGCVSSDDFVSHATKTSQGTKMPRADWKVLVKYPVVIPPKHALMQYNCFIDNALGVIQNLVHRNRNLRQTRDLLLPKLILGEI